MRKMLRGLILAAAVALALCAAGLGCILVLGYIALIESDRTVSSESGYGFTIGMTKVEALDAVKHQEGKTLLAYWKRSGAPAALEDFERPGMRGTGAVGSYEVPPSTIQTLNLPLAYSSHWRLEFPLFGINARDLEFQDDRLVRIRRSRYIVGRP